MKPQHNAPFGHGGRAWLVLVGILLVGFSAGCSTQSQAKEQTNDEVIGRPPPADEDPFFVKSMPGEAVPVASSGKIEEEAEQDAAAEPDKAPHDTTQTHDTTQAAKPEHSPDAGEPDAIDSDRAAAKAEPSAPRSRPVDQPQCFSCVRICPAEGDCDAAKEDVICGWGVHDERIEARRMAKAECDATLDMARQMPVWSEIAGECPVATCR